MTSVLIFIGSVTLAAAGILLSGWTLSLLWLWFLVPLDLPALNIAHAVGLACIVAICVPWPEYSYEGDPLVRFGRAVGMLIGKPLYVLAIGWLAKSFM